MANSFTYQDQKFGTGDTVALHLTVKEGDKTRTQVFEGIIISIGNSGAGKSITVRKIATGTIGVERIVPLGSPNLVKIDRLSEASVRRAKLYFLRDRIGKRATKVKTKSTKVAPQPKKAVKKVAKTEDKKSPAKATKAAKTSKKASK